MGLFGRGVDRIGGLSLNAWYNTGLIVRMRGWGRVGQGIGGGVRVS